jgi:hypothetical protein
MSSDDNLKIYSKILAFVSDLKNVVQDEPVQLYYKLLKKTPIGNTNAIARHLQIFRDWCAKNSDAIVEGDLSKLTEEGVLFSKTVYIPVRKIALSNDSDTCEAIIRHLQLIHLLMDPSKSSLISALTSKKDVQPPGEKEGKFIDNFMHKIESAFSDKEFTDPMSATMHMLSSGIFNDMVQSLSSEVNEGGLDLNKLLGGVQGMMGDLSNDPATASTMNSMMALMGSMNLTGGGNPLGALGEPKQ